MTKEEKLWWTVALANVFALTPETFFGRPADWLTLLNAGTAFVAAVVAIWSRSERT